MTCLRPCLLILVAMLLLPRVAAHPPTSTMTSDESARLAECARAVLWDVYDKGDDWISVHAAEILVQLGNRDEVRRTLLARLKDFEASPARIGAWRAMVAVVPESARGYWLSRIEAVLLNPMAGDRFQALESLAKLEHRLSAPAVKVISEMAASLTGTDSVVLALWALAVSGDPDALLSLAELLRSPDAAVRRRTAYAFRRINPVSAFIRQSLRQALETEPPDSMAHPYLLFTAFALRLDPARTDSWRNAVKRIASTEAPKVRFEALQVLASHFTADDLAWLAPQLDHDHGDVRAGAALAVLRVLNPESPREEPER